MTNPIDYIAQHLMIPILGFFYAISHSYGVAIILLTLVIRGVIFPLSMKQYQNMRAMQEIQPKIKELQAKYKDNPQELSQATMAFYQEHKVNPLGSCLPLLIQMPFLFALYRALLNKDFIAQEHHQGFLFIPDLTEVGVYHAGTIHWANAVLVLIFGVTTFLTQKMTTTDPNDPMQRQMQMTMPFMITAMFVFFPLPSGVLIYTVISNFFTMGQYWILQKWYPKPAPAPAGSQTIDVAAKPTKGDGKKGR